MRKKSTKIVLAILLAAGLTLPGMDGMAVRAEAVSKKATVKLNKTQVSLKKGKKVTLKVVTKNIKELVSVKWSSKDKKIATVNSNATFSKGKVTAKKAGKSTVITCNVKYKTRGSEKVKSKNLACRVKVKKDSIRPEQSSQPSSTTEPSQPEKTNEELYAQAVKDAAIAEEDEIKPLVSLTREDPFVTWDNQGRVLLCTWHSYPDSYPKGETVTAAWGAIWTFTDKEMAAHAGELRESKDAVMRMRQLISIDPNKTHSTVTGVWVNPSDVVRPAYQSDAARGDMRVAFSEGEEMDESFKAWFDQNILDSYYYGSYPWTRLGYTYDWADNGKEYGLTEFLIKQGAQMEVAFTETTSEFLQRLYH